MAPRSFTWARRSITSLSRTGDGDVLEMEMYWRCTLHVDLQSYYSLHTRVQPTCSSRRFTAIRSPTSARMPGCQDASWGLTMHRLTMPLGPTLFPFFVHMLSPVNFHLSLATVSITPWPAFVSNQFISAYQIAGPMPMLVPSEA